jgi:hypothetical protein
MTFSPLERSNTICFVEDHQFGSSEFGEVAVVIGDSEVEAILFRIAQTAQFKMSTRPFLTHVTVMWECWGM